MLEIVSVRKWWSFNVRLKVTCSPSRYSICFCSRLSPFSHPLIFFLTFMRRQNLNYTCNYFRSAEQRCASEALTVWLCLEKADIFFPLLIFTDALLGIKAVRLEYVCLSSSSAGLSLMATPTPRIVSFSTHLPFCFSALPVVS